MFQTQGSNSSPHEYHRTTQTSCLHLGMGHKPSQCKYGMQKWRRLVVIVQYQFWPAPLNTSSQSSATGKSMQHKWVETSKALQSLGSLGARRPPASEKKKQKNMENKAAWAGQGTLSYPPADVKCLRPRRMQPTVVHRAGPMSSKPQGTSDRTAFLCDRSLLVWV